MLDEARTTPPTGESSLLGERRAAETEEDPLKHMIYILLMYSFFGGIFGDFFPIPENNGIQESS
jgi:hypothetical protein